MAFMYIVRATKGFHPQTQKFERLLTLFQSIKNGTITKFGSGELSFESRLESMNHLAQRNKQHHRKAFYLNGQP